MNVEFRRGVYLITNQYRMRGLALMFLAKKYFLLDSGDRVPTVEEFCRESNISQGTLQSAINILKEDDAIQTISRGHLGTFVEGVDHKKLLSYLKNKDIVGSLPLPYTKKYEGLATGIYKSFLNSDMRINLSYMNGSRNRLSGLEEGRSDFIITSDLTADYLVKNVDNLEKYIIFPESTYVSEHVVIFRKGIRPEIKDGAKVGVDDHSIDYSLLTDLIVKNKKVRLIKMPYNQIVKSIENGVIDYAIWNMGEVIEHNYPVDFEPIKDSIVSKASKATIIGKKKNVFIKTILQRTITTNNLINIQKKVEAGKILPEY